MIVHLSGHPTDHASISGEGYLEALGPLRPLVEDDSLTEIMVVGPDNVYVESGGRLHKTDIRFGDEDHLLDVINVIVTAVGRRIDGDSPIVDARLLDGSRVAASIAPVTLNGPLLTIRKFSRDPLTVADLVGFGSLSEDAAELRLNQDHVCSMEARQADVDGRGRVAIRDLVIHSLRMRPDRIVVGECRGGEALDMLQAMNTGHDGSMTTVHANSPRDCLSRLETLVLMAGMDLPVRAIRQQISSAVDLVVQISRLRDGSRRVTAITEVVGMEGETISMQDIFSFEAQGAGAEGRITGRFAPTGVRPVLMRRLAEMGLPVPAALQRVFPGGMSFAGSRR